ALVVARTAAVSLAGDAQQAPQGTAAAATAQATGQEEGTVAATVVHASAGLVGRHQGLGPVPQRSWDDGLVGVALDDPVGLRVAAGTTPLLYTPVLDVVVLAPCRAAAGKVATVGRILQYALDGLGDPAVHRAAGTDHALAVEVAGNGAHAEALLDKV